MEEPDDDERSLVAVAKDTIIIQPFHILTSRPAQRAYISSILLAATAFLLALAAVATYASFYYAYIPQLGLERSIHLQFGDGHPRGIVSLRSDPLSPTSSSALTALQKYDVSVEMNLPRTRDNMESGNFMVELMLLGPTGGDLSMPVEPSAVLARESRAAMMTYRSWVVEVLARVLQLPWYLLGRKGEKESLKVEMMEKVEFQRGWRNVPTQARVEIKSDGRMQIYGCKVVFAARLRGLRWLMYNQRFFSFAVFTTAFWAIEMAFALVIWLFLSYRFLSGKRDDDKTPAIDGNAIAKGMNMKGEADLDASEGLSDTARTFPTSSRQPPLRYESPKIKKEEQEEKPSQLQQLAQVTLEADDEDEDADFLLDRDSGIGTSMESSTGVGRTTGVRKRKKSGYGERHDRFPD